VAAGGLVENRDERTNRRSGLTCAHCSVTFAARTFHTIYCSTKCKFSAGRSKQAHVRAARVKATGYETFTHHEIFSRDGWICGLCGGDVDESLAWPHSASASLDHVTPLSRGGLHRRANVQLAHLRCNLRKNNRVEV
jgi:hypothetical protein